MTTNVTTPSDAAVIDSRIERRERDLKVMLPGKVVAFDQATLTVDIEPQDVEVWREQSETEFQNSRLPEVSNLPILYPRGGGFGIYWPLQVGDFGLVACTKYSLDLWRQKGEQTGAGDMRRFTLSGAMFLPVSLYPDDNVLAVDAGDENFMVLSKGGTSDFVALAALVKSEIDDLKTDFNLHKHTGVTTGGGTSGITDTLMGATGDMGADFVKAE